MNSQTLIADQATLTDTGLTDGEAIRPDIAAAWDIIAPVWPLQNVIACNPLQGLEKHSFEDACLLAQEYFQQPELPVPLENVNRQTIKWCQAFFDSGQATLPMPGRFKGLYGAWQELAVFDRELHLDPDSKAWLQQLSKNPEVVIFHCLRRLQVPQAHYKKMLRMLLISLPGWAGYIKYRLDWSAESPQSGLNPVTRADYLAMRLVMTCLFWPKAYRSLTSPLNALKRGKDTDFIKEIMAAEQHYATPLLHSLSQQARLSALNTVKTEADAQWVFCIDVRSEPFRRALEGQGRYQTLGFAGFFGIAMRVRDSGSGDLVPSCPVLLSSQHTIEEVKVCSSQACQHDQNGQKTLKLIKRCYYSLKYTFSPHFGLVETLGPWSGLWMMLKTLTPSWAAGLKAKALGRIRPSLPTTPIIELTQGMATGSSGIPFKDQCQYAKSALSMMGLTRNFAPLVIFCGHGSSTQNNAYATALDCGACGGRHGGVNAQILAKILNKLPVRHHLAEHGIIIPQQTHFMAAEHNTTTDAVTLYDEADVPQPLHEKLQQLKTSLRGAQAINSEWRSEQLGAASKGASAVKQVVQRSVDWAQTRPEWGLAGNAAFIIGDRQLSKNINLQGRAFLHSYDWQTDPEGKSLEVILTAPMVVAQWINNQYLFSTHDNVAYGSGSKVTQNITGKLGVMQGNASDLMHGLPLQSIYINDNERYHQPLRLLTVVHAPRELISNIIARQQVLQKLFGNGWVRLAAIDPSDGQAYLLQRDFTWKMEQ